jgi:pyridinium-3,5-bisthiocarboxylic acid mononucleotide nickel chelatase
MTRVAYLDCVGGLAGDMLTGALIDAGGNAEVIRALPHRLHLADAGVRVMTVKRHELRAISLAVDEPEDGAAQTWAEMRRLIQAADLPARARERALDALAMLARAEARVHGVEPEAVHFHELAGADTLIDLVGVALLLDDLEIDQVVCSPLPMGRGVIAGSHGRLPLPAPATLELLRGAILVGDRQAAELVTPTGAALASTIVDSWGEIPAIGLDRVGYGAGLRDFADRPNIVRVLIGEERSSPRAAELTLLEATIDDLNPELVPDAIERSTAAGALDVWVTPVQMKKNRPGIVISALAPRPVEAAVAEVILRETSTLGVRTTPVGRYELEREERRVEIAGESIRVKLGTLGGRVVNRAPEHDDCVRAARRTGRSVKAVWGAALAAAQEL